MREELITLAHGSGGSAMAALISEIFQKHFGKTDLNTKGDSAILPFTGKRLAMTTDGFVVDPPFFPGGDIGKLAVCGTLNDLAVSGAVPVYLTAAFVLEEGFPLVDLEKIVASMAKEATDAGVPVVAGDTKVVPHGKCDKVFITTTGAGFIEERFEEIVTGSSIEVGDKILVSGPVGDHGTSVLLAREGFSFKTSLQSDCRNLFPLIREILNHYPQVRFMRDATRGGLATVLNELAQIRQTGITVNESKIPVREDVLSVTDLLGLDPYYMACEGTFLLVSPAHLSGKILEQIRSFPGFTDASIIGEITGNKPGRVLLQTITGGKRILDYLYGDQLPRIC